MSLFPPASGWKRVGNAAVPITAPCAPLAEVVAQQESATIELQARVRTLLAPLERAGFTGNLTLTFRKADNSPMSRIKSVEIVQM